MTAKQSFHPGDAVRVVAGSAYRGETGRVVRRTVPADDLPGRDYLVRVSVAECCPYTGKTRITDDVLFFASYELGVV